MFKSRLIKKIQITILSDQNGVDSYAATAAVAAAGVLGAPRPGHVYAGVDVDQPYPAAGQFAAGAYSRLLGPVLIFLLMLYWCYTCFVVRMFIVDVSPILFFYLFSVVVSA